MALRTILKRGDRTLEKPCRQVTAFNDRICTLLDDMRDTLIDSGGVGLAAPQVGVLRRVVVVLETNVPEDEDEYILELINPEIIWTDGTQDGAEGCLSVPNMFGFVERPMRVRVRAYDRQGNEFEVEGEGLTARAFCHELDHLDGHLFTEIARNMMTSEQLDEYMRKKGDEQDDGEKAD